MAPAVFINGIITLILLIFLTVIFIILIKKYVQYKNRTILTTGIGLFFLFEAYWAVELAFFWYLFTNSGIPYEVYFIVGYAFIPISMWGLFTLLTDLLYKEKKKIILTFELIYTAIMEPLFFIFLFSPYNRILIGDYTSEITIKFGIFLLIYLFLGIIMLIIGCTIVFLDLRKSNEYELRLKGNLLLLGMLLFIIGMTIDTIVYNTLEPIYEGAISIRILARIFLLFSAIFFYGSFMLPEWMKKLFMKKK